MILDKYSTNKYKNVLKAIARINELTDRITEYNNCEDFTTIQFTDDEWLIIKHPEAYLSSAFASDLDKEHLESLINCLKGAL